MTTPTIKTGKVRTTRVAYSDIDGAGRWLWRFVGGAKCAGVRARDRARAAGQSRPAAAAWHVLPATIANGCWVQLAYLVRVHHVDPIRLLQRLTGERYTEASAAANSATAAAPRSESVGADDLDGAKASPGPNVHAAGAR